MAEDTDDSQKTEEPTQKRLSQAREKGQVAISREINNWFIMLAAVIALMAFVPGTFRQLGRSLMVFFESPHAIPTDVGGIESWLTDLLINVGIAIGPIFGLLVLAGIAATLLQIGPMLTFETIKPAFAKISPKRGLGRLFSMQALMDFAKGFAKLGVVGAVAWVLMRPEFDRLERFYDLDVMELLAALEQLSLKLLGGVLAVMTAIAGLDLLYQKIAHLRKLRMSREELRDEYKESEGDPIVKGRLRQIRMERARRRMMQEVPKADVVITNPTHFAVALRYDQNSMGAPVLVAKGTDLVARRIREIAEEHKVPIVSNPPLARALYASVEIDQEIPPEHYKAVAEVIGYVMRLRRGRPRPNA